MSKQSIAVAALLAATGAAQAAQTYTFRDGVNGYNGTRDTMVRSNETASPGDSRGVNYGLLDFVSVDGDDGSPGAKPNQGLINFEGIFGNGANQIKATDTILSAKIALEVDNPGSGLTLHDMRVVWNETTVTWNSLVGGVQADGIEAVATPILTLGANNGSENVGTGPLLLDVTSSLQAVQAGTLPGYGWAMIPFAAGSNGIDFHTREFGDVALRPTLMVEVSPVPEPEAYALMLSGLALVGFALRRRSRKA